MRQKLLAAVAILIAACAGLAAPAAAQESAAPAVNQGTKAAPAPARKKKLKKKPRAEKQVSEYKFSADDPGTTYRFDKKGDPIVQKKTSPGKRSAAGKTRKALPARNGAAPGQTPALRPAAARKATRYVCPMGDYEGDSPGQCPKCGMTLVEKK